MTDQSFVELEPQEIAIPHDSDPPELLYRQVCAHIWDSQYGKPNLDSFGPQGSDKRKPSFSRSSIVTAQQSRDWHNANARSKSMGVWACSVVEIQEAGTRGIDDSETPLLPGTKRAPGHAFVDYRHMTKPQIREVKAKLLMAALGRKEIDTVDNSKLAEADEED